jgi:hypothetical protein
MMATKKQLERKKKAREQKAKARVASRRHKLDVARREESRGARLERKFREKTKPIVNNPEAKRRIEEAEESSRLKKLENNARILKALEEEYEKERNEKRAINERLESEGHHTLQDKIGALENKARNSMSDIESETGGIDLSQDSE